MSVISVTIVSGFLLSSLGGVIVVFVGVGSAIASSSFVNACLDTICYVIEECQSTPMDLLFSQHTPVSA
mgnify:CR=1 FL=1